MARNFGVLKKEQDKQRNGFNPEAPMDDVRGDFPHHYVPEPTGEPKSSNQAQIWLSALIVIAALGLVVYSCAAHARDLGQWEKMDPEQKRWFQSLMQPDTIGMGRIGVSCCGEGDGYWADEAHVRDGKLFAVITDERPDDQLMRMHENVGTEYEVPTQKIVGMEQRVGNPTGHIVIFLGVRSWNLDGTKAPRPVLCYVQNGGV
jgi:hypothetical protein